MSIADTATGTTAHDRTFWRADYARFARAIRRTRHARRRAYRQVRRAPGQVR